MKSITYRDMPRIILMGDDEERSGPIADVKADMVISYIKQIMASFREESGTINIVSKITDVGIARSQISFIVEISVPTHKLVQSGIVMCMPQIYYPNAYPGKTGEAEINNYTVSRLWTYSRDDDGTLVFSNISKAGTKAKAQIFMSPLIAMPAYVTCNVANTGPFGRYYSGESPFVITREAYFPGEKMTIQASDSLKENISEQASSDLIIRTYVHI